ncbi:MAG TPA: cytochrome c oxidase subunit 3 [Ferruginibacter sp.]|jgi:cytochrome c oxidase subunit 3|nr:cytochrome c oxidase subunit 3 [Ferruginibacter sp.]HMX35772.1 cytochrome c oxidase subunit 3 [Ferruginibacter sp.]HMX78722.1 cytochrome c oxidase subunit 3 [Ferruginibacter sp.]HMZ99839.1 cytochrome c oxidase subunit 3 [Ferruginibacter sp.]HNA15308.1 cytochrome c oxidase subunit 3 [Ferruginibacter sp.]
MSTTAIPTNTKWWGGGRSPFNASYGKVMMWYFLMSDAFTFGAFLISYGTIRFSVNHWADPNQVFNSFPGFGHQNLPLAFVSLMTFILIFSSVTMVLAVHEGHKMNRKGVEKYMILTILGGLAFLGCQAWEWTHLLTGEHIAMLGDGTLSVVPTTVKMNPWGAHVAHEQIATALQATPHEKLVEIAGTLQHGANLAAKSSSELITMIQSSPDLHVNHTGPIAFGGYFFGITGFHGFHVFSGVVINVVMWIKTRLGHFDQRGHYEMIEKAGLYWHFVDLVWVFVFLCFYLI